MYPASVLPQSFSPHAKTGWAKHMSPKETKTKRKKEIFFLNINEKNFLIFWGIKILYHTFKNLKTKY